MVGGNRLNKLTVRPFGKGAIADQPRNFVRVPRLWELALACKHGIRYANKPSVPQDKYDTRANDWQVKASLIVIASASHALDVASRHTAKVLTNAA